MKLHIQILVDNKEYLEGHMPYTAEIEVRPSRQDELVLSLIKIINNFRKPPQMQ